MKYFFNDEENYEKPLLEEILLCSSDIVAGASTDVLDDTADENEETA